MTVRRILALASGFLAIVLLLGPAPVRGEAFEPFPVGAAARGMAGAYTAMADNAWAGFWNPAALGYVKVPQVAASMENLYGLDLVRHSDLAYVQPDLAGGTLGFTWLRLDTVGDASFLDYSENVYALSYGRGRGKWRWGGSIKYFAADGERRGSGFGADLALKGDLLPKKVNLSVVLQDINQPIIHWETGATERVPRSARTALGFHLFRLVNFSLEEDWRGSEKPVFRGGASFDPYRGRLSFRAGFARSPSQGASDVALGMGFRIKKMTVDFAWTHNDELGDTPTVSLLFRL